VSERRTQLLAGRFELATDAANTARPRILAQRVDHRAADTPLGEGLELDAARIVETMRGIDQADHTVLDEVAEVNRMRHGRRHAPRERFNERQPCFYTVSRGSFHLARPRGNCDARASGMSVRAGFETSWAS